MADKFDGIRRTPTVTSDIELGIRDTGMYPERPPRRLHESLLRSYQILDEAKKWLEKDVAPDVILEWVKHLETEPDFAPVLDQLQKDGVLVKYSLLNKMDEQRLRALEYAALYGNVTKKAHLHWLIDQMVRCLSSDYEVFTNGITESGEDSYEWRVGRSPIGGSKRRTKQRGKG